MDYYGFGLFSQWQQVCVSLSLSLSLSLSHTHTHNIQQIAYSLLQVQLWIQSFFTSLEFHSHATQHPAN
jgi:hypothetical protein